MFLYSYCLLTLQHNSAPKSLTNGNKPITPIDRTSIIFTLKNQVGGLASALQVFQGLGINVVHIELQTLENGGKTVRIKTIILNKSHDLK